MSRERKSPVNIALEQNSDHNLRLLAAQRQLYSEAKRLRLWRLIGSIGLAIIAPFVLYFQPTWGIALAAFGAIWLVVDRLLLKRVEVQKVKQAAAIQEEFDTELFKLPWNRMLVGSKVTPELISLAVHRYKGSYEKLRNWYPDTGSVLYPLNVLICQRINLVWDWQLRRRYAIGVASLTVTYVLLLIAFAIATDRLVIDFLLGLLFPALSAVVEGIEVAGNHSRIANEKEETATEILALWEQGLKDHNNVSRNKCRNIQDCIYQYRSDGPLVPDWWYNRLRDKYEVDMYATAAKLIKEAEEAVAK
jgi:hypothetical protein